MRPRPHGCPAALSFMATGPYDVRPHLVALYYADDATGLQPVLAYGVAYMARWCEARSLHFHDDALRAATAHGLLRIWRPSLAGHSDARAKDAGLRAATFRLLSNTAREVFRRRLGEGAMEFVRVAIGSQEVRPSFVPAMPETTWWNKREAGRLTECKLVELRVGRSPPPALSSSRAAPRHVQQLSLWAA